MSAPKRKYRAGAIYLRSGILSHGHPERRYFTGAVPTRHGFVSVYAEDGYANWDFIWKGISHDLTIRRTYTKRGLVTVARRFAADVVNGRQVGS